MTMLRQCVSIALVFSLIALSTSGVLMIILNSFTFQMQMHPVHKIFGIIMVIAGCLHVYLNFKPIKNYLGNMKILAFSTVLSVALISLFIVGLNKPMDLEKVEQIQQIMSEMGSHK